MRRTLIVAAGCWLIATPQAQAESRYHFTIAGANAGGFWSLLADGIDRALAASHPGSVVSYRESGGGFANIPLLAKKAVPFAFVHNAELKPALDGRAPFAHPITDLRAVAILYNDVPLQVVMDASFANKHRIETFADIATRKPPVRVAFSRRGNAISNLARAMFETIGVNIPDIDGWKGRVEYTGTRQAINLLMDGRVDMVATGDGVLPGRRILRAARAKDIIILSLTHEHARRLAARTGTDVFIISGGTYDFQPADVTTVAVSAALMTHKDTDEKTVHDLARALIERIGSLPSAYGAAAGLTPELLSSRFLVPFHRGAERYYRDAGLR